MNRAIASTPRSRVVRPALVCAAAAFWFGSAAAATPAHCWARCVSVAPEAACTLPPPPLQLHWDRDTEFRDCAVLGPRQGKVQVRYRRNNMPFTAVATDKRSVADLLAQSPADPCGLGDLKCQQQQMNARGAPSGAHGADGRVGQAGGQGAPCSLGLPCGEIGIRSGAWTILLQDAAFDGAWVVSTIRSPQGEVLRDQRLAVDKGIVKVPAGLLKASTLYGYQLKNLSGETVAGGEFAVLPDSAARGLKRAADERIARGARPEDAWLETLVENQLEWNVHQFLATGSKLP